MVERWRQTGDAEKFFDPHGGDLRQELWLASRENKKGLLVFFSGNDSTYADVPISAGLKLKNQFDPV